MNTIQLFSLAISPLALILVLLLVFRVKLVYSSIITLIYTGIISLTIWQIQDIILIGAILKGMFVGIDIALIIGGALLYIYFYKNSGRMEKLQNLMQSLSTDKRIQILVLGFFLVSFLEGTAGFGVPAAVVAPLLVALGIAPVAAVAIALIGDSTAVTFGAIGTPIRIGYETLDATGVAFQTALINAIVLLIIPVSILAVYEFQKKNKSMKHFFSSIPLAILATITFAIPYVFFAYYGYDFPTLLGSIIGVILFIICIKLKLFVPKETESDKQKAKKYKFSKIDLYHVIMPYALFVILFVVIRYIAQQHSIFWRIQLFGQISHTFNLFNPGIIFLIVVLLFSLYKKQSWSLSKGVFDVSHKLVNPFIIILAITAFVQIMVFSHINTSQLEGMLQIAAKILQTEYLLFISGYVGVLGTFIAGSATVSNLLFGELQASSATTMALPVSLVLALQLTGAAVGNMISLTNIVAAQTTVRLENKEKEILKLTIIPCLVYVALAGLVGFLGYILFF